MAKRIVIGQYNPMENAIESSKWVGGGGRGFVGTELRTVLEGGGYPITIVSRQPGVNTITWAKLKKDGLPQGTKTCVNLAGHNLMDLSKRWNTDFKALLRESRLNTTMAMCQAINESKEKPNAMILITGVGAYQPSKTMEYDETAKVEGDHFLTKLCTEWESAAKVDPPVRRVIIRAGAVLGRNGGMVQNMIVPFFFGLGGPIGDGKQYLPWIHVHDLARLIHYAAENDNISGVLNGVAPQVITNHEFTRAFAKALNRPACIPVPELPLNLALGKERAEVMTKGQKVIPKRVLDYGFKYKYPNIDAACKEFAHLLPNKTL